MKRSKYSFHDFSAKHTPSATFSAKGIVVLDTGHYLTSYPTNLNKLQLMQQIQVCLFGVFRPTREFTLITGERLQTETWQSWPLNSEGSLTCHTYCDTGHPTTLATVAELQAEELDRIPLLPLCLRLEDLGNPTFSMRGEQSYRLCHLGHLLFKKQLLIGIMILSCKGE